jgi:phospholipid/cholesterol/gamma-HCH transport system permease protein
MKSAMSMVEPKSGGEAAPDTPQIKAERGEGWIRFVLSGPWTTQTVAKVDSAMREHEKTAKGNLIVDLSGLTEMDTAGAWLIERMARAVGGANAKTVFEGVRGNHRVLLEAAAEIPRADKANSLYSDRSWFASAFALIGKTAFDFRDDFLLSMHILGATIRGGQLKLGRSHGVSFAAIVHQLDRMAVGALPVIILMSFIIGAIIAQQGAFQLRYFGAEIFVVDLVGVLVLREIAVILTAIMVAGRSGSSITAEIGSMKMREEIDALTVIGLNPIGVLVFPRLVALVIALPLLTIVANISALVGAALVAQTYSGISISAFIGRLHEVVDLTTYFAGLIKAPFMALIIGIVASAEGMKVKGSAESLGRRVTASVVKAIFVVIVVDGLFAMFYAAIDF